MEKKIPKEEDYQILKKILLFADKFDEEKTATMLRNELAKEKIFPSNKDERDSGDLRQYFSYPFHWWKGKDRVNYENVKNIFNNI